MDEELRQLRDRLERLERDVDEMKSRTLSPEQPWWQRVAGRFENDPAFKEIVRLGKEYREKLGTDDAGSES